MTSSTTHPQARIEADPTVPAVVITREFDAPPEAVYRAHVDPGLVARWLGPRDTEMRIDRWEARTGGGYRYTAVRGGEEIAAFYGSFHEMRPAERIVQTFTWEGMPDGVSLDVLTLEDLGGRTRLTVRSTLESFEARDGMLASGMESGVQDGYAALDDLLANG